MTSNDLMPKRSLSNEPEMESVRKAAFNAVIGLLGKGYSRAEVMEALFSDTHTSAISSIMKIRVALNKGEAPWEDKSYEYKEAL